MTDRLIGKLGGMPAVPLRFNLDFIMGMNINDYNGLQEVFEKLNTLENKIERGQLTDVVLCGDCPANGCCSIQIDLDMGEAGYCSKGRVLSEKMVSK